MKHYGKISLGTAVLIWAALSLFPLKDTPFASYIHKQVQSQPNAFKALSEQADRNFRAGKAPSFFKALKNLANESSVDLQAEFFPKVDMVQAPNLEKKNEILLEHFHKKSKARLQRGLDLQGGAAFTLELDPRASQTNPDGLHLQKAIEVIAKRINALGIQQPLIRPLPPKRIEVQLPGLNLSENPEAIETLIRPARLDFRLSHRYIQPSPYEKVGTIRTLPLNPNEPNSPQAQYELMEQALKIKGQSQATRQWIKRIPEAHGNIIEKAYPTWNEAGQRIVGLEMTPEGKEQFGEITTRIFETDRATQTAQSLGIVLDGKLESAPGINEPIVNGQAVISGSYTDFEVRELVSTLNNPLEFKLSIQEKSEIGPTLAADAVATSIKAALLGALLVAACMSLYYGLAGLASSLAVGLSLGIVLGALASLGATLTLPGIAALVLTIGMAVDANILIFERIREELKLGKSSRNALTQGYNKALSTILDANITTLITACILIYFGTNAVRGFGITLAIGIGASVFGALVLSRVFLEFVLQIKAQKLIPNRLNKKHQWKFLSKAKPAFIFSWILVFIGAAGILENKDRILGIDFRGGAELTFECKPEYEAQLRIHPILAMARSVELGEVQARLKTSASGRRQLNIQLDHREGRAETFTEALQTTFTGAGFVKVSENRIGASISESTLKAAFKAVLIALLAILLYVAIRFEWGFGFGAVTATVHDLLMSVGLYVILGQYFDIGSGQFTAPMVAAALMIIGYSINDTIVVFDRIREELGLHHEKSLRELIELALNRTLSRTLLTSLTSFLAALALFIFGAGIIKDFSLMFLIGILTGTFSSIFIATPVLYWWYGGSRKKLDEKELSKPEYTWEQN